MNLLNALFGTSIGKKVIMAVSGVVLIGFVIGHLVGNLQIFGPPETINHYAHLLQSLGGALWLIRGFLLLMVVLHVWSAVVLTLENRKARPSNYEVNHTIQASYASRTMRWSGFIVLAFLLFHLAHFTLRVTHPEFNDWMTQLEDGTEVRDVWKMMVVGFSSPIVTGFYILSIGLLSMHLSHGLSSLFQSLGLKSQTWGGFIDKFSVLFAWAYFLGNAAIPLYCMFVLYPGLSSL
jgi:succinate dehydrogenase / fumarate reductase cytochrome b subunit